MAKKPEPKATAETPAPEEPSLKEEIQAEMAADLDEEVKRSDVDVAALQKERDDFEDKYLRAAAEISNMNNRFKKERADLLKYDGQRLATAVLPVMDNLERALAADAGDDNGAALKKGVEMVLSHLETALKDNAVTEIAIAKQAKFDPTLHQAVQTVAADKDHPKDTVVQVLQKGYEMKGRVLRPAMVVVAN
ncbi:nucleotide exchange factor GrpE [Lacticaseibacillus nasuensis]|uniref:Protein GrpE n=1 Tax=Lacticaseibacillus nasuensis JCM 17158 TaxID=1291734 RepID=A0A0R1JYQ1_9LACO|nr:nucleotide exchange factor GrpE [Lacticaseibacillus nasuensis]KRK74371.1 Molecular chaperone GrpE (heat shock protein) [Lacticaseibacillus nasuensis JCM 17158]